MSCHTLCLLQGKPDCPLAHRDEGVVVLAQDFVGLVELRRLPELVPQDRLVVVGRLLDADADERSVEGQLLLAGPALLLLQHASLQDQGLDSRLLVVLVGDLPLVEVSVEVRRGFVISIAGDSVGFVVVGVVRHRRRRKLFARRRCRLQEAGNRKATTGSTQSTTFIRLHECIQHFLMLYFFHASLFTVTS